MPIYICIYFNVSMMLRGLCNDWDYSQNFYLGLPGTVEILPFPSVVIISIFFALKSVLVCTISLMILLSIVRDINVVG